MKQLSEWSVDYGGAGRGCFKQADGGFAVSLAVFVLDRLQSAGRAESGRSPGNFSIRLFS